MNTANDPTGNLCQRCGNLTEEPGLSFIYEEAVCRNCLGEEAERIARLELRGIAPATVAGCGFDELDFTEEEADGRGA